MLSCGETSENRKSDIEDILGDKNFTTSSGDPHYCMECLALPEEEKYSYAEFLSGDDTPDDDAPDPSHLMVRQGMLISTIVFLMIGLLFTFINIIFTVINIANNPVSAIVGIDGLVAWNMIAGVMYFLVLVLWGAEYNIKIRRNLCISDTLRPGVQFSSHSNIGWCCLLLICPMFLHLATGSLFAWRQWKRYYSTRQKQAKEMRLAVQDPTQGGTDILF